MWLINLMGVALIGLIIWWFWLYKPKEVPSEAGLLQVKVENGVYAPARIALPANKPVFITFIRKDVSPCAGTVVFQGLEISAELPVNKPKVIKLPALAPGEYAFTCQMQMYRGELFVR